MLTPAFLTLLFLTSGPVDSDHWIVLFDGRSTGAWRGYNLDSFPGDAWVVEGDTLRAVGGAKTPRDLITREKYADFELELEWKLPPGGNSGVLYRVAELAAEPSWHSGPEMQILDDDAYRKNPAKTWSGALYDLLAPSDKTLEAIGNWNEVRLVVRDDRVEHWLNGKQILEYELGSPALDGLIASSKFKALEHFGRAPEGHVALQHHGEGVWFRNIRILALPGRKRDAVTGAAGAKERDWVALFNGRDLSGWKTHGAERWAVDGEEILGEAVTQAYGYLSTEKAYRNFELKAKFKAEGTGNSGIFYHSTLAGVDIKGVQVEVDPHPGKHTGGLYESAGREWLVKPRKEAEDALQVGGWNEVRALVRGPHVQTWINGVPAVDYVDPSPKYTDGVIALQLHAGGEGRMRFKDIFLRDLE